MGNSQNEGESIFDRFSHWAENTNLCLRPEYESEELAEFTDRHRYLSLYKDPYYGECHVLEDLGNQSWNVVIKQTLDRKDHQAKLDKLGEIALCGEGPANRNIIKVQILADLEKVGFLWRKNELYARYDYILFDLEKQFEHRMESGSQFSEGEVKTIIRECTKGYLRLELTRYTSVRMKHIYFCGDGSEIKLAHPRLFNYKSNLQTIYEDSSASNIYLSPEQVYALEISDHQYECGWASNAFSFGMIILSLMTMKHLNDLYNYRACEIDFRRITELINVCNNRYSFHLISVVRELLREKEAQRLTFRNLYNRIESGQSGSNPVELMLVEESRSRDEEAEERVDRVIQPSLPKYPNYIAALIKPKVDLNGEYMSIATDDDPKPKQPQIIANKRFRYSTMRQESVGSYLGEAVSRDTQQRGEQVRHGKGVYQYIDGQTYIGDWKEGKMNGTGKLYYKDKKLRYEGEFKDGLFHGNGTEYSEVQIAEREEEIDEEYVKLYRGNWIKYEGFYVEDRKEGAGRVYFKKGMWRGNFKKGQPNGQGIFTSYISNATVKGEWVDGQLKRRR